MKKYVENEEVVTYELGNWVGVVFDDGTRGVVIYIGDGRYHIICTKYSEHNVVCGGAESDGKTVAETLALWKKDNGATVTVDTIYCFDSYKELMTWFAEGINDN